MPDPSTQAPAVRLRELLALDALRSGSVLGGERGLDRAVTDVLLSSHFSAAGTGPGVLLVVDGSDMLHDSFQVDIAVRGLAEAGGAGLLVLSPSATIGLATSRLATKLGVPVVVADGSDPLRLCETLRTQVLAPQLVSSTVLTRALSRLRTIGEAGGTAGVLDAVASVLDGHVTLVGSEGGVVAGADLDPPLSERSRLPVPMTERDGDLAQATQPISLAPRERPSFWLVARRHDAVASWLADAGSVLQLAAWFLGTRLVTERLRRERDARSRLGVLTAITAAGERPEPALAEQIGVLGWSVSDWNTAVHIQATGEVDQLRVLTLTDDLQRSLESWGLRAHLVERPDGWTLWVSTSSEPPPASYRETVRALRQASRHLVGSYPGLRLHTGIGRPYLALEGLQRSLAEAREASIIAHAGGGDVDVQHVDELGVRRILLGWYASESFAEFAGTLLGPLVAADVNGELLTTLESFLDHESSPTETAAHLGVHRNTVINRMERARALLTVDLDDGDERLAVQLACRVARLRTTAT